MDVRCPNAGDAKHATDVRCLAVMARGHLFWADDLSPVDAALMDRRQGRNQVTDTYLLALAIHRGGVLVTFDRGLAASAGAWGVGDSVRLLAAA